MDNHVESFEFIDIENIKLEPDNENELLEDPLLPRQADIEFIERKLKEEPQVKLEQIKDEIIEVERTSKNGEQLVESGTFHRKNSEPISRLSPNTTVIPGKDCYRVTDKLPIVEPNEDSEITDGNIENHKNTCRLAKSTGKSSVDTSIRQNKDQNIELACIDSIWGSSSRKSVKTQLPEITNKKKSCVLEKSDCLVSITEHKRSKPLNIRNFKNTSHSHKKQTYSCEHCSFKATDINCIQMHTNIIHNHNKIKKCPVCPEEFEEMPSLNNHIKIEHPNYERFHCENYERYTHSRSDVKHNDIAVHSGIKPFQCFHCSHFFSIKDNLKRHITNVHLQIKSSKFPYSYKLFSPSYIKYVKTDDLKGTKFYCSECKFSTYTLARLKRHYKIVHVLKKVQYICNYCQRLFTLKCSLVSHIKGVHVKPRDWKCTHCSYASFTKKGLREHVLRKHTEGGKPRNFLCHLCSYKAAERRTLDKHIKAIHTKKDNPFKCHLCDQTFNFKAHFIQHLKRYHLFKETYPCKQCNCISTKIEQLIYHYKMVHNMY